MKTPEQLHAHQASLPPLRSYFLVWERPHGSYTWTIVGPVLYDNRNAANNNAQSRVDDKHLPICDCVVSEFKLARMPTPEGCEPCAALVSDSAAPSIYYGSGHAR
jgi:hypothetical protein